MATSLTIYEPSQYVYGLKNGVAEQLGIDADKVRVINAYVGGAFGSKGSMTPRTAIIASIARRLEPSGQAGARRATRALPSRPTAPKPGTRSRSAPAATASWSRCAMKAPRFPRAPDPYAVGGTKTTTRLYACPNVDSMVSIVRADRNTPGFMRSPPEVPYMFALESAMDELAVKLNMDPIELRRINDTMKEPIGGKPYTSRSLMACFDEGAKAFGWAQAQRPKPKSMTDGDWLIGYGCAATCYPTQMAPAAARVRLQRDGRARVEIAGHEIGNGAYTVIGQAAAEKLGVPFEKVSVFIGDSDLPPAPVAGGSNSTASTCSAVMMVCDQIRQRLFKALMPNESLVDKAKETVGLGQTPVDRRPPKATSRSIANRPSMRSASASSRNMASGSPMARRSDSFRAMHKGQMRMVGGDEMKDKIAYAFGAEFVEVRINRWTHEIRVPRLRRRVRRRPHHESAHRAQPADGRPDLGNVVGAA